MTNKLSARQAGIIIFIVMLCNKMLSLNSLISYSAQNNAWIIFLVSFAIDFLFVLICVYFMKIMDKPILEFIKEKLGKTISIILAILISVLFLFKTTQIMVDIYLFFVQLIYVEIDRIVFVVCFLTIVFYLGTRKLRSIGRTAELLVILIATSLVLSFLMSMKAIDFEKLLPIFSVNVKNLGECLIRHNLWFGDFWIFFFFIGNVKMEKNTTKKLMFAYVISCAVVLLFVIIFTCAFGNTASMHRVAVIDVTEFNPRLVAQGRFNWLVYFMFPIALVLGIGIYSNYIAMCYEYCMSDKLKHKILISGLLSTASILAMFFIFRFTFTAFYNFVTGGFYYYTIAVQYVLPIVLLGVLNIKFMIENKKLNKNSKKTHKNNEKISNRYKKFQENENMVKFSNTDLEVPNLKNKKKSKAVKV